MTAAQRKTKVALAATSQALSDARQAVNQFALRCADPDAKQLMAAVLDAHIAAMTRLRAQLAPPAFQEASR
jgi:hypothetical protein